MTRLITRACAVAFLVACAGPVPPAPDAPTPDVTSLRTSHGSVLLAGSASPGARVVVTREPAFAQGSEVAPVAVDPSTGRWSVEVPLVRARRNVFVLNTVAADLRASPSARVEVEQVAPRPRSILLSLEESRVRLGADGRATLRARARIALGEEGLDPSGWHVRFGIPGDSLFQEHVTDADGVAEAVFDTLTRAGPGQVEATVVEEERVAPDVRAFEVLPGPPASCTLELATPDGLTAGPVLDVRAGDEVHARVVARDVSGNVVFAPWTLETTPSDTQVAGGVVRFTRAGDYTVVARVLGGTVPSASATARVAPGPAAEGRTLVVAPATAIAGEPVSFEVLVEDAHGNPLTPTTLTVTASGAGGSADVPNRRATFRASGPQTLSVRAVLGGVERTASRDVFVHPAPAATLALTLGGAAAPLASPVPAAFGEELLLGASARDAFGNVVEDAPFVVTADRGLLVLGRTVLVPSVPGDYVVNAQVPGTAARGLAAIRVAAQVASTLEVRCPEAAVAGASFTCAATARDAAGNVVSSPVTWSVEPAATATVAGGHLTQRAAGSSSVTASLAGGISVTRPVSVSAANPASLALTVTPAVVQPGGRVRASVAASDAFGNRVDVPVTFSTDAPGALVAGDLVTNLSRAGTWSVRATASGLDTAGTFRVDAAAGSSVRLVVGATRVSAGQAFGVSAVVSDAFGNPLTDATQVLVDGASPDGRDARLEAGRMTLQVPGTHEVSVVSGALRDAATVEVLALPDVTAPTVTAAVEGDGGDGATTLVRPGSTLRVTLRATDDEAVTGLRLRVSGPAHGVVHDAWIPASGRQVEEVVTVSLPPALVGELTLATSAQDASGHAADGAPRAATVDFHFDRVVFSGAPAAARARTVSLDAALVAPGALAVAGGTLLVASGTGSQLRAVEAGGRTSLVHETGDTVPPSALGVLPGASGPHLFAPAFLEAGARSVVQRLPTGAAAQLYTVPALLEAQPDVRPAGLVVDTLSSPTWMHAGFARTSAPAGLELGAIASMPGRESGSVVGSGTGAEASFVLLADHRVGQLCLAPGANPAQLYFTGERHTADRSAAFVGLYRVPLSAGRVAVGATPTVVFEEPRAPAAGVSTSYGPCLARGSAVWFTRWATSGAGAPSGRLSRVPAACAGCVAADVAQGTGTAPFGALTGLVLQGDDVVLSESSSGRVLRLTGLF